MITSIAPPTARRLLAAALLLGVAGNWLLRAEWRAGFALWTLALLAVAFVALRARAATAAATTVATTAATATRTAADAPARDHWWLLAAAALLALAPALRDADLLFLLNILALFVVAAVVAWRAGGRALAQLEPREALRGVAAALGSIVGGAPTLALHDAAPATLNGADRRSMGAFGIGSLIAAPVLLAVAILLGSADPLFGAFLEETSTWLDAKAVEHVLGSAAVAWVAAGALRGTLAPVSVRLAQFDPQWRVPFSALTPLLGGLALLLSAWIGLQVRVMFGGAEYVATAGGVTVADYARRGFFELIIIAGIVLAALLLADEVLERELGAARRSFRAVAAVLVGLVAAVLVSAVVRLGVYLRFYGLTEDRVLALAVLVWVGAVLAWFGWTVLRNARARFAPGVLVLSALWLALFNVANPERWIVETNVRRAEQGLAFDVAYHATLSGDAIPALLNGAQRLDAPTAQALHTALSAVWQARAEARPDWRGWSVPYVLGARRVLAMAAVPTATPVAPAAAPAAADLPSGYPPPPAPAPDAAR
jgi:hypothetical protein